MYIAACLGATRSSLMFRGWGSTCASSRRRCKASTLTSAQQSGVAWQSVSRRRRQLCRGSLGRGAPSVVSTGLSSRIHLVAMQLVKAAGNDGPSRACQHAWRNALGMYAASCLVAVRVSPMLLSCGIACASSRRPCEASMLRSARSGAAWRHLDRRRWQSCRGSPGRSARSASSIHGL